MSSAAATGMPRLPADAPAAPLLSDQWFRVAHLQPRLAPQVQLDRVAYRGQPWVVLTRSDGSQRTRLNRSAYAFVGRFDGQRSVQVLWELLLRLQQDDAPTQAELMALLLQLYRAGFVSFAGGAGLAPDFGVLGGTRDVGEPAPPSAAGSATKGKRPSGSLLAIRIPLGNPDALLARALPSLRWLFTPRMAALYGVCAGLGLVGAALNTELIARFMAQWLGAPHVMAMTWVAFVLMKAVHEAAHALTLKHFGGSVPQWGVTLMVFTPAPYVDASAADSLASPRQRLAVTAAGAAAELVLASAGLGLALLVQGGWLQDLGLVVFSVGAVSSLLVNANPLLRFDGYHALTDALELPNLAQRSQRHWVRLARRVLGLQVQDGEATVGTAGGPTQSTGERRWWWAYAPAAWMMRCVLAVTITAWLGGLSAWLGAAVGVYFVCTMVLLPALRGWRALHVEAERGARWRVALAAGVAVLGVAAVPLPHATWAPGVVWLPDDAAVRAGSAGRVQDVRVKDGQQVAAGDVLFVLHNPQLAVDRARLDSRLVQLRTERAQFLAEEPAKAQRLASEAAAVQAQGERLDEKLQQLELRAPLAGRLHVPQRVDWNDRHVHQGQLLAYVLPDSAEPPSAAAAAAAAAADAAAAPAASRSPVPARLTVRVALPAEHAAALREAHPDITLLLAGHGQSPQRAQVLRDATAVVHQLPSAALGDRHGGDIVTDPVDPTGLHAARGVVLLDLALVPQAQASSATDTTPAESVRTGTRAWVRFGQGHQALLVTLAGWVQQSVLVHFNTSR
jgi:putative peptide zinc metalloprotease protein